MYGLTKKNRSEVLDKIEKQKDFLYSHYIELNGEKVQLASFFKNTFINADRYIAELQNRVWSLVHFANERNLVNVFITLTLPSEYHRKKTLRNGKLIRNPKFAHQDINVLDIITKKRPDSLYLHEFKVHKSVCLNYWNGKVITSCIVYRKFVKKLGGISNYDDLVNQFSTIEGFPDDFEKLFRRDIEIYDIETKKRTIFYQNLVFKQKSIGDVPRWTGKIINVSLDPLDYMPSIASKKLTDMWTKIRDDRAWKDLDKDDRVYFRVTEPHKDGTPHLHISAWVPKYAVDRLVRAIHRLYPAPLADISTSYIPYGYELYEKVYKRDGRWQSAYKPSLESESYIKVHIEDTVSYLMKYIYKTLDDLRDGKGITEITMWYIYHGICRFYTSRTLISLNVYRPLNGRFGLLELTQHYQDDTITVFLDPDTKQPKIIQYEDIIMWKKKEFELKQYDRDDRKPQDKPIKLRTIDVEIDGEEFYMYRSGSKLYPKQFNQDEINQESYITPVTRMKMVQLWNYYHSLDPDDLTLNLKHYGLVQNTMIERGLIDGEVIPLDRFDVSFDASDLFISYFSDDEIFNPYNFGGY